MSSVGATFEELLLDALHGEGEGEQLLLAGVDGLGDLGVVLRPGQRQREHHVEDEEEQQLPRSDEHLPLPVLRLALALLGINELSAAAASAAASWPPCRRRSAA